MLVNIGPILAAVHLKTENLPQSRFILLMKKRQSAVNKLKGISIDHQGTDTPFDQPDTFDSEVKMTQNS